MNQSEMAEVAAHWWAKALERPKFDNLGPRGGSPTEEMAGMLATIAHQPVATEKLTAFENALREILAVCKGRVCLDCDYGPDGLLAEVAEKTGVSGFPWKTTMWLDFDSGTVKVKHGYGAEIQVL